ncbi:hypothetical protein [Paraburkholderia sacchari]|uniref:hypothetical protein n=1 Tax=Paraburkholderia sacchari TaxID=159450 RepID=UPI001BCDB598|nr:hypothetical protein [Paraburkholderia sacchari]
MSDSYQFYRENEKEISRILHMHHFRASGVIDEIDSDFDISLLVTEVGGHPTLFDMGAVTGLFERRWNMRVQLVTPEAFEQQDEPREVLSLEGDR